MEEYSNWQKQRRAVYSSLPTGTMPPFWEEQEQTKKRPETVEDDGPAKKKMKNPGYAPGFAHNQLQWSHVHQELQWCNKIMNDGRRLNNPPDPLQDLAGNQSRWHSVCKEATAV
ncbi:unnamed protein product [Eretmochelys imbricata]